MTQKKQYRIKNWAAYNQALVQRGSLTIWFDEEALAHWYRKGHTGKRGRPEQYSDLALQCILTIRELFHLPLRQTEGFVASLMGLLQLSFAVPDFTTYSRRSQRLPVSLPFRSKPGEQLLLVVDATGLKFYGDGEWTRLQHGKSKHRRWRKLHIALNPQTHMLEAAVLTKLTGDEAGQLPTLLKQTPGHVTSCIGDGGYDKHKAYAVCAEQEIHLVAPPQHHARCKQHGNVHAPPLPRDATIRAVRKLGSRQWKIKMGYHVRSLVETAMFRIKNTFSPTLRNKRWDTQQTQAMLRCRALNIITHLGMPKSLAVPT